MSDKPKRRILIFSTAYYPFVGGAEVAVKELTDRLSKDFEFDLITSKLDLNLRDNERIGSVNVYRLGSGNKNIDKLLLPFRSALLSQKLRRKNEYFCFWSIMVSFASLGAYISNTLSALVGTKKIPIVLNLQEGDSETHLKYKWGGLISLSWRIALKQTTILTGLSNFLLDRAKKYGYMGKSVLIPNGVDLSVFTKPINDHEKNRIRKILGKEVGERYLVTTGRLSYKNGTDDIIRSLNYLPENVSLLVIGVGEEENRLKKLALDLEVKDRVKFLGFITHNEIVKYLSVSDVFVRPSRSEGFGNSFIEAMASGIPVVATPVGGIVDFIDDKETGLFCTTDNPKSIAEAVLYYLNDKISSEKIVRQAKDRVISKYSWDKIAYDVRLKVFDNIQTS